MSQTSEWFLIFACQRKCNVSRSRPKSGIFSEISDDKNSVSTSKISSETVFSTRPLTLFKYPIPVKTEKLCKSSSINAKYHRLHSPGLKVLKKAFQTAHQRRMHRFLGITDRIVFSPYRDFGVNLNHESLVISSSRSFGCKNNAIKRYE